jgi:hypothetical protein
LRGCNVGDHEFAVLEWTLFLEGESSQVVESGLEFRGLKSNDEIKLFLDVDALWETTDSQITAIPFYIKTRSGREPWQKRRGQLKLPKGYTKLFGSMPSGHADNAWFLMLINSKEESAALNLGYAPVSTD